MPAFLVYTTSAGAGKTHTLTKEYLQHTLPIEKFDSTIALTFTNKAVKEMKERIIEYLFELSQQKNNLPAIISLIDEICNETNLTEQEIFTKSKNLLYAILHNYFKFSVSTIDSFVYNIVKIFSRELNIPINFNVELESKEIIDNAIKELFEQINNKKEETKTLTDYLVSLSLSELEEGKNWDIRYILSNFSNLIFKEDFVNYSKDIINVNLADYRAFRDKIRKIKYETLNSIHNLAKEALKIFAENNIISADLYQGDKGIFGFFNKLSSNPFSIQELLENKYVQQTIEEDKWSSSKSKKAISPEVKQKITSIYQVLISNSILKYVGLLDKIEKSVGQMALLGYIAKIIEDYYEKNNILHISVFNQLISNIVINEPAPYIYERSGQRYFHFLIDEFQDTSCLQWRNLLPLIGNALSQKIGLGFIVGDAKQSIYRFRNSEVEQLMVLPQIYDKPLNAPQFVEIENQLKNFYKTPKDKNINFRSGEYIVEFNNRMFQWVYNKFKNSNKYIEKSYKNTCQNFSQINKGIGFVKIFLINDKKNLKQLTLKIIQSIIDEHYRATNSYNGIAILTRYNEDAKEIARFLMNLEQPIAVISDESLELSFSPEVCFIIDILKILKNNNDNLSILNALTFLYNTKKIIINECEDLSQLFTKTFLSNSCPFKVFNEILKENRININWKSLATQITLNDLITELLKIFEFDKLINAYLIFFQDVIFEYSRKNGNSLAEFLQWWDEKGKNKSISIPEGADAVRIMSIHKAKGLQFTTVIYPYANFSLKNNNVEKWVNFSMLPQILKDKLHNNKIKYLYLPLNNKTLPSNSEFYPLQNIYENEILKSELDNLNVHYVAMTRAEKNLYVITNCPSTTYNEPTTVADIIYQFLKDELDRNDSILVECPSFLDEVKIYCCGKFHPAPISTNLQVYNLKECFNNSFNLKFCLQKEKIYSKEKIQWGNILHNCLAEIKTIKDYQKHFSKFIAKNQISKDEEIELKKVVEKVLANPQLSRFFQNAHTIKTEIDIVFKEKLRRPDRIIMINDEVEVIDFKTGIVKQSDIEQVKEYCSLLKKMNFRSVKGYIANINYEEIEIINIFNKF